MHIDAWECMYTLYVCVNVCVCVCHNIPVHRILPTKGLVLRHVGDGDGEYVQN